MAVTPPQRYVRRVIRITADDSPNVQLMHLQRRNGWPVTYEEVVPGVLSAREYEKRERTWDEVRKCIGLKAQFWKGKESLLFPPQWLNHAEWMWRQIRQYGVWDGNKYLRERRAEGVGIDTAEGGDMTSFAAVDRWGLIELTSERTPDTFVIAGKALAFIRKHGCKDEAVCIDPASGGKELADRLRHQGLPGVRTVPFGGSPSLELKRGVTLFADKVEVREEKYVYLNRRAQMYHELSQLLDPNEESAESGARRKDRNGFALPPPQEGPEAERLRKQLAVIPRLLDDEGRYYLPSKGSQNDQMKKSNVKTLLSMIGHSPDEADALVLAVHAMVSKSTTFVAGAIG